MYSKASEANYFSAYAGHPVSAKIVLCQRALTIKYQKQQELKADLIELFLERALTSSQATTPGEQQKLYLPVAVMDYNW